MLFPVQGPRVPRALRPGRLPAAASGAAAGAAAAGDACRAAAAPGPRRAAAAVHLPADAQRAGGAPSDAPGVFAPDWPIGMLDGVCAAPGLFLTTPTCQGHPWNAAWLSQRPDGCRGYTPEYWHGNAGSMPGKEAHCKPSASCLMRLLHWGPWRRCTAWTSWRITGTRRRRRAWGCRTTPRTPRGSRSRTPRAAAAGDLPCTTPAAVFPCSAGFEVHGSDGHARPCSSSCISCPGYRQRAFLW